MGRRLEIFLHPGRAARELERLETEARESATREEALGREVRGLRADVQRLESEKGEVESRRGKLDDCVNELAGELLHVRQDLDRERGERERLAAELAEKQATEEIIAGFEKTLEGVEGMKSRYEQRIARLRAEIVRLRGSRYVPVEGSSDLEVIDMATGRIGPASQPEHKEKEDAPEADWLEPLGL